MLVRIQTPRRLRAGLMVTIGLAAFLAACQDDKKAAAPGAGQMPPANVAVVTVEPETLPVTNELPGRIAPTRVAEVRPRVTGILVERVFTQGSIVKAGEVLYRIDPAPFRVRYESAKATLARAKASQIQARQLSERQQELKKRNIVADQQVENAVAALAQADADVAVAQAGLDAAQLDLQYTEVRAPISGRIGRALITEGALISSLGSESLALIQQLDPIYADFTQSSNDLMALRRAIEQGSVAGANAQQATVRLLFDDGSEYPETGRLLFSEAAVDATTGQITLRGEFPNPKNELLPGMYVRVQIVQGVQNGALAVPQQAVQRDAGGQALVFVVDKDNVAHQRKIITGRAIGGRWVVDKGLEPGDRVVVEGFQMLRPGSTVAPQPWTRNIASADPAKAGPAKAAPAQSGAASTGAGQAASDKAAPAKPDAAKSDGTKSDGTKPDAGKAPAEAAPKGK